MPAKQPKTAPTLEAWVQTAEPGARFAYARLAPDTADPPARALLRSARNLYEAGLVLLLQRREADGSLSYIAQRTSPCLQKKQSAETAASALRPRSSASSLRGGKTGRPRSTSSGRS